MGIGRRHRSTESTARPRAVATLAWTASLLVVAALLGACSAPATTPRAAATGVPPGSSDTGGGGDWAHVLQVVANLKAQPPAAPVVCLLGGSAARESTIDDASWSTHVV